MYNELLGRMRALLNNLMTSKSSEYVQIEAIECLNTNEALLSIIHIYKQYWWSSSISMVGVGNTKKRAKISLIGCGGDSYLSAGKSGHQPDRGLANDTSEILKQVVVVHYRD